jgi:hypothetical protein
MDNIYFLTFYTEGEDVDGGINLTNAVEQIKSKLSPYFFEIFTFNKKELKLLEGSEDICNSFEEELDRNLNANKIGYFDFKGFLIKHTLSKIPENSILIYHDANFDRNVQYWETDWENIKEISLKLLNDNSSDIFFQFERDGAFVKEYVKTYTIDKIITDKEENAIIKDCFLINAARFIIRNTQFSREFIDEYLKLCKDKTLIAKSPNENPHPEFKWSCGDQDVLNCLIYKYILEGKFHPSYPIYSFLYRVIRFEKKYFTWPGQSWNPHSTGVSKLKNNALIEYINKKTNKLNNYNMELDKNILSFLENDNFKKQTELCELFKKYGSDKNSDWHNYSSLYFYLFKDLKEDDIKLFEVGIYHGASVRAWRDFFSKGKIYAGDVEPNFFLKNENVECFYCNQDDSSSISDMWNNEILKELEFDIIIDDGKHEFISNINFLRNSIQKLKKGGIFIVEDLTNYTVNEFNGILNSLKEDFLLDSIGIYKLINDVNKIDNNLLIIKK